MFYILKGSLQKLKLQKVWPRNDLESRRLKAMVVMMIVRCTFAHSYVRPLYVLRLDKRGSRTPLVYYKVDRWHAGNRLTLYRTIQALQLQHCSHFAGKPSTEKNQTWTELLGKGSSWRYVPTRTTLPIHYMHHRPRFITVMWLSGRRTSPVGLRTQLSSEVRACGNIHSKASTT